VWKLNRVCASCLLLTLGCSTTSTIVRTREPPLEGRIVGGSNESIFVATEAGGEYEIARSDVTDVDYPGNVHAAVGAGVLGYGVLNIALGMPGCNERTGDEKFFYCAGVFTPAIIGAGLILWGLVVHEGQTSAFDDTSRRSDLAPPEPEFHRRRGPVNMDGNPAAQSESSDDDEPPRRARSPRACPAATATPSTAPAEEPSTAPEPAQAPAPSTSPAPSTPPETESVGRSTPPA